MPGEERAPVVSSLRPTRHYAGWVVLALVCVGQFMVILDLSIVNVALPSIQRELRFSDAQLQWVVNAYALSFGGFLLFGGRAADLFGRRRVFMTGLALFAGASLFCAVAQNQTMLLGARAVQGLGGAVLSPATLTIITTVFTEPRERSRAIGIWSAMAAAGGASGALLGGILTDTLSWRWIFYINVPIGIAALLAARVVLPESRLEGARPSLDIAGSLTVTGGLLALVYAIAGTYDHAWSSAATLVPLALAVLLFGAFVTIELRATSSPLVPFRLFRSRALTAANVTMFFVGSVMFPMWLFLSLYMQDVLHFSALKAGLGFLPPTAAIVVGAQVSSRLVPRVGPRWPLAVGVALAVVGMLWLSRMSATGSYVSDVLGGATLATLGMGLAMTPMAFAATGGVAPREAGLASGILNTARQIGGSLGLAILATVAVEHAHALVAHGTPPAAALASGFDRVFVVSAVVALGAVVASLFVPARQGAMASQPAPSETPTRNSPAAPSQRPGFAASPAGEPLAAIGDAEA